MKADKPKTVFVGAIPMRVLRSIPAGVLSAMMALDYALALRRARKSAGIPPVSLLSEFKHSRNHVFANGSRPPARVECPSLGVHWGL